MFPPASAEKKYPHDPESYGSALSPTLFAPPLPFLPNPASSAPSGVDAGTGGLVDDGGLPAGVLALSLAGLVGAGIAGRRLAAARG